MKAHAGPFQSESQMSALRFFRATHKTAFGDTQCSRSEPQLQSGRTFLAVAMLMLLSSHFVDDFYLCEPQEHAQQAFECFSRIHSSLGFKMKEAKSKPPAASITLLGVCWEISPDSVRASAGPESVHKLLQWI